jgi:hypothetical protein
MEADAWRTMRDDVDEWVDKAERLLGNAVCAEWHAFAGTSCDGAASLGHRLSKPFRVWEHEEPDRALELDQDPLDVLETSALAGGPSGRGPDARA